MKNIEIIIPAYNSKDTIETTLDSIYKQKTNLDFEVLISNDNSDYSYKELIDKYNDKLNIVEIINDTNKGPGVARQLGIDNSFSKYIIFMDSDDYFYDEYAIDNLYKKIEECNADVVISNFKYERDNIIEIKEKDCIYLHGKIYRRDFLNKHKIKFNSSRANEDNGFNRLILLLDSKIAYLDKITYVYHENSNSITRKNNREYAFYGLEGYVYNMYYAINEARERNVLESKINALIISILVRMYFYYIEFNNHKDIEKLFFWTKKIYLLYKKRNELTENYYINLFKNLLKLEEIDNFSIFLNKLDNTKEIDVIIPFYNSNNTLDDTLLSISNQSIANNILVTIIDDYSYESPINIINRYKSKLNINYIKLDKNVGSGLARQIGLNKTNGSFIVFIDADDLFYDELSLKNLYDTIIKDYNYVLGAVYHEKYNRNCLNRSELHGKMYRREFLEKKKIHFNNTRFHEDNAFNNIVMINDPKFGFVNKTVYIYKNNFKSITAVSKEKEFERLEILVKNIKYVLRETKNNKCSEYEIRYFMWEKFKYLYQYLMPLPISKKDMVKKWFKKYKIEYNDYFEYDNLDKLKEEILNNYKIY